MSEIYNSFFDDWFYVEQLNHLSPIDWIQLSFTTKKMRERLFEERNCLYDCIIRTRIIDTLKRINNFAKTLNVDELVISGSCALYLLNGGFPNVDEFPNDIDFYFKNIFNFYGNVKKIFKDPIDTSYDHSQIPDVCELEVRKFVSENGGWEKCFDLINLKTNLKIEDYVFKNFDLSCSKVILFYNESKKTANFKYSKDAPLFCFRTDNVEPGHILIERMEKYQKRGFVNLKRVKLESESLDFK